MCSKALKSNKALNKRDTKFNKGRSTATLGLVSQVQLGDTISRPPVRLCLGAGVAGRGRGPWQVALLLVDAAHGQESERGGEHEQSEEAVVLHVGSNSS